MRCPECGTDLVRSGETTWKCPQCEQRRIDRMNDNIHQRRIQAFRKAGAIPIEFTNKGLRISYWPAENENMTGGWQVELMDVGFSGGDARVFQTGKFFLSPSERDEFLRELWKVDTEALREEVT